MTTVDRIAEAILLAHGPCICGDLATVEVVVRWKNGPRHYWYCEQHAATVLELAGVSRKGYQRGLAEAVLGP